MRLWSVHPKYLDTKGLIALWREALLAQHVLEGKTKGYKNHPQLNRFKETDHPVDAINQYLVEVYNESVKRGYKFNKTKINWVYKTQKVNVTEGQLIFEFKHLLNKLKLRDPKAYDHLQHLKKYDTVTIFEKISGAIEPWEII